MTASDAKFAKINQTVTSANQEFKRAMITTDPRYKAAMAQRASAPAGPLASPPQASQPPAEQKGLFGKIWDGITSIF
ncbi:hypothetical protein [Vampirovibrio chlorellavorus]|uniref:hypothetical protein n=1 Tax=Vampirovibrio chlorellavorus TaxID=758823 RepID=UPI0026F25DD9|nr:hypothetical protein [Vampirovibrio chlorellavorus]